MRKLPSTFGGGFAPGAASVELAAASLGEAIFFGAVLARASAFVQGCSRPSVELAAASLGEAIFFGAALARASAFGPAGISAGVPGSVGNRVGGGFRSAP